ncbi:hypothetical protein [Gemmobacter denitrificans]|uniref:Gelsolin-like domain-containing protein n=1 Tax=Gemmobacter denitrificans TaxID=3123040 RepID=A0ABU8BXX1_9RHOB
MQPTESPPGSPEIIPEASGWVLVRWSNFQCHVWLGEGGDPARLAQAAGPRGPAKPR